MPPSDTTSLPPISGRYAAIDCGTNSIKLLVADLADGAARFVFGLSESTRIGEGMNANEMRLSEEPMRRTLDAIEKFASAARAQGALETVAIATAALREAVNADEFVARVSDRCGVSLEVISGDEEARLSFLAVRDDPHWRSLPQLLVIDLGGGSTELIHGEYGGDRIEGRTSVRLGAVRLTEALLTSDPPTKDQVAAANREAKDAFSGVVLHSPGGESYHIVGVGGTITNFASMKLGGQVDPEAQHGLTLTSEDIKGFCAVLARSSVAERRQIPGLDPARADIILAGGILLAQALSHIHSDRIDVSTRGLRWGVLYDRFLPK